MAGGWHVALLRGINVGGKNKLPMRDLVAIVETAGGDDVRTHIQSGNVIFRATRDVAARLPDRVADAIAKRYGFHVPVITRTASELRRAIERNPFLREQVDPAHLHVAFLAARPSAARAKSLDPDRSPPDRFTLAGREIYLCCPNGMARTKLTNQYFDSRLGTVSTMRNWNTSSKLLELVAG